MSVAKEISNDILSDLDVVFLNSMALKAGKDVCRLLPRAVVKVRQHNGWDRSFKKIPSQILSKNDFF